VFKEFSRIALMTWAVMIGVSIVNRSVPQVRMLTKGM
jgi:hypothetical protein